MIICGRAHNTEEAEIVGLNGFPFVEISLINRSSFIKKDLYSLRKTADTYGLKYLAHGPEEGNAWAPDILHNKFLPDIKSLLECAGELDIKLFTIHFWIDSRFINSKIIKKKIEMLKEMADYAADKGIKLCIENLSERFSDFSIAFDLIDSLGMTLDIGHGELLTNKNTAYGFSSNCLERICHMHIHDNRGGNSPGDDLHLPLGDGTIDFFSILTSLKEKGFDKTATLEVKPEHMLKGKKLIEEIWNAKNALSRTQHNDSLKQ